MSDSTIEQRRVDASPPVELAHEQAQRTFSSSIAVSGIRCLLTYVVFPFIAPVIGLASGVGPVVGLIIGLVAIAFNVFSIRRFWRCRHPWRWQISTLNVGVIGMLAFLVVQDLGSIIG